MSSKIKVDTIENVAGSGNVSLGSGHNLVVPGNITGQGTAAITSNATVGGTLGVTGVTTLTGNLLADTIVNRSGDSDSGLDLSTNDVVAIKIAGAEKARMHSDGKFGIGSTSPRMPLTIAGDNATSIGIGIDNASGSGTIDIVALGSSYGAHGASAGEVWFYSPDNINIGAASSQNIDIKLLASGSKRAGMRRFVSTDSANVWCWDVGWNAWSTTRSYGLQVGGHRYYHSAMVVEDHDSATSYSSNLVAFIRNGNDCGEIVSTGATSCSYSTSSDYRIKQNIEDLDVGIDIVKKLKPRKFKFKSEENQKDDDGKDVPNPTVHGFVAHEVQETITNSHGIVNGIKDATEDMKDVILNKDGGTVADGVSEDDWKKGVEDKTYPSDSTWKASHTKIKSQSMDYGKLTPLLTKALQEAIAKIEVLEAKVAKLEG